MSGPKRPSRLTPIEPFDPGPSIAAAVAALHRTKTPYALAGAVALGAYGIQRATKDVDFAVPVGGAEPAAEAVEAPDRELRPLRIGGVAVCSPTIQIDFIDRRFFFRLLSQEAIDEAQRSGRTVRAGSLDVPVVSLEYLLAMKMVSGEPKDDLDVQRILALEALDYAAARALVQRHMTEATANRLDTFARAAGRPEVPPRRLYKNGDDLDD